jgi:type IV pilus assembly protein PilB
MADKKSIFVSGGNGNLSIADELAQAQDMARRYRCEFVDLKNFHIQHELFRKIKVDLMFRYNFVPLQETQDGRLVIAIADPSQLMMIDDQPNPRRIVTSSNADAISDVLKKTEQLQRVPKRRKTRARRGIREDIIRMKPSPSRSHGGE